ncbi:hypothetical protein CRG98_048245 [Punica granatum]|uniref:DDE Tnp4 domain-containing protein n=1 Tax=Punica granatum TaxID=22663 RepID=A0A2I0HI40_PUNGR|nr:hypothetical protein CRG98_048245 [Punica granatum]
MNLSNVDGSNNVWYDREKKCSMILQAIVDPDLRFRDIITGWPGKLSDATILKSLGFYRLAEEGQRLNGKKASLFEGTELREYIVGDSGFPLLPWLLTPFKRKARAQTEAPSRSSSSLPSSLLGPLLCRWALEKPHDLLKFS